MPSGSTPEFSASYDLLTKIVSAIVCAGFLAAGILLHSPLATCLFLLFIFLTYAWSPRAYVISGQSIIVQRLIRNAIVPLDGIRAVRPAAKDDFRGCIRLFGNGGFFGYYGLFRTSKLGKCWWYLTNRKNSVVLITKAETALFSPDDVDGFIGTIRATVPVPEMSTSDPLAGMPQRYTAWKSLGTWVGIAVAVLVSAVVALAVLYSPGPPGYTLTPDTLTIHDRFYPVSLRAAAVDGERVRVVDLLVDREWRPVLRTNGFANSHYRSGWFRVANGQTVRMYRADSRRLVLLPPKGDGVPVLLEVREADNFVSAVRQQWFRP